VCSNLLLERIVDLAAQRAMVTSMTLSSAWRAR